MKSNAKILFVLAFGGSFVLLASLITLIDLRKNGLFTAEDRLLLLGLDLLNTIHLHPTSKPTAPTDDNTPSRQLTKNGIAPSLPILDRTDVRRLALKIRQRLRKPGDILLMASIGEKEDNGMLLAEALAACLARRDEHVLIINSRNKQQPDLTDQFVNKAAQPRTLAALSFSGNAPQKDRLSPEEEPTPARYPGLADLLSFNVFDLDQAAVPSTIPGVDYLPFGQGSLLPEGFATHRMNDILSEIRNRYSLTLLLGPPIAEGADLELLIPYTSGLLFHLNNDDTPPKSATSYMDDLYEVASPIIGATILVVNPE